VAVTSDAPPASLFPDSIFNSDVESWAVDPNSAEYAADIVNDYKTYWGEVGVNTEYPIYWVPAGQPLLPISVNSGCPSFLVNTGSEIPIPSYVSLSGSSDNPLTIYQPSTGKEWEFWQAEKSSSGSWSACWGGVLNMTTSNGVFPYPYGMSASGISYLATQITETDIASGSINHAIMLQLPACYGYVYPANRTDCSSHPNSDPGQPAEGQWFRLPANLAMPSGLAPFAQMVFRALQNYGAVVTDYAGGVMLVAEQPSDWAAEGHSGTDPITASWDGLAEYQVVADLPWAELQAVDPLVPAVP
jgi:hypothetical protein